MSDELLRANATANAVAFDKSRERLEEIINQVRSKDIPLAQSLDLYEEAIELGTKCANLIDRTDFSFADQVAEMDAALADKEDEAEQESAAESVQADSLESAQQEAQAEPAEAGEQSAASEGDAQ